MVSWLNTFLGHVQRLVSTRIAHCKDSDEEKQRLQKETHHRIGILSSNATNVSNVFRHLNICLLKHCCYVAFLCFAKIYNV